MESEQKILAKEAEALIKRKEHLFAELSRIHELTKKSLSEVDADVHLRTCSRLESSFEKITCEILSLNCQLGSDSQISVRDFSTIQTLIEAIVRHCLKAKARGDASRALPAKSSEREEAALPRLSLPIWDGDVATWLDFRAQFDSAVDRRTNLSGVAKFQYLQASLKGEPLSIVTQYVLSDESYDLAYRDLVLRYENKRRLASHHLNKILNFKAQCISSGREHIKFMEVHRAASSALRQLKLDDLADFIIFELSYRNLSTRNQKEFDLAHDPNRVPTMKDILSFVEKIARSEELRIDNDLPTRKERKYSNVKGSLVAATSQRLFCFNCKGNHMLYRCPSLLALPIHERKIKVMELGCCVACFHKHQKKPCNSKYSCKTCGSRSHNSVLHPQEPSVQSQNNQTERSTEDSAQIATTCNNCVSSGPEKTCILGTLQCLVQDVWGNQIPVRALLDPGSQISIISSSLARRLNLNKMPSTCQVEGIGTSSHQSLGSVNLTITPMYHSQTPYTADAIILPRICNPLPKARISTAVVKKFNSLELADPNFHEPGRIDLLLGVEVYSDILSTEEPTIIAGSPSAVRTTFGYVVSGRVDVPDRASNSAVSLCTSISSLEAAISRFWETEEVSRDIPENPADVLCEQHFLRTHEREPSGRFVVRLPFVPELPPLGNNEETALRRLKNLERRLAKDRLLAKSYEECINEYIHLGHISITSEETSYLLPHHAVFKESSTTTKCRVVFDFSSPDNNGLSLYDRLYRGPPLLSDIALLLISFRFFKVCFVADIKMMYRMVSVHPEDRRHLTIAWRSRRYKMNRLPFGLKPAGYLAGRCLIELANLHQNEFPEAARAILNNRYADDFCTGADSLEEANELRDQLINLLAKGGFEIRRWSSNVPEALSKVPETFRDTPTKLPSGEDGVKVLGVMWDQTYDAFVVHVVEFNDEIVSKRSILSYISKIYDVMGLFSPTIILAKQFMQRLWLLQVQWDEPLKSELAEEWRNYTRDLASLSLIKIPRFLPVRLTSIRLVGFSDASERGMAAAVFIQWSSHSSEGQSCLLKAKTKLAPLKTLTIPRLELCAAVLLAKLVKSIIELPDIQFESINLFTDSTIVLAWLERPLHEMKIFVSNRIAEIKQTVPTAIWGYVAGQENPADLGSRGVSAMNLKNAKLWWHGPNFLTMNYHKWPGKPPSSNTVEQLPELKGILTLNLQISQPADEIIYRFSSFSRLQRVLAYMLRFSNKAKSHQSSANYSGCLGVTELENALYTAIRITQMEYFRDEITRLQNGKPLSKELQKLSPFFDLSVRLIRVGGRLNRASFLPKNARHPFLLPRRSHLAVLICDHYHKLYLHSGPRTTCAAIQRKFWIPSLMSLVKTRIHRCTPCLRLSSKPHQPLMADVIPARTDQTHCWANCALDFGGPFFTRESKARKGTVHKSYICVFVCLTTRAIHLEMVTDLTTAAFLAAFNRFTSRRSVPHTIYSDRGSNFVGARGVLQECSKFLRKNQEEVISAAAAMGTKWLLNVPYGPNFNGCAENGIKSAKALIRRQIGDQVLTFEEFMTLLCRVELILNSRPISFSTLDINDRDVVYLTPGHFIVGREMTTPPEKLLEDNMALHDRWKRVSQMTQVFWKIWSTAYLHELMQRGKWTKETRNLQVDDIVYVTGIGTTPLSWPLGRVLEVFSNPVDNTVRVARVRVRGREFIRPANKLIIIPTEK